jgi:predicted ATPase
LPLVTSDLIGRTSAAQHVRDLRSAYRVVSLTGPGGIGKTALAIEVLRSLLPTFEGDVRLVEFASLSDPSLTPSAVAGVLDIKLGGNEITAKSVARAIGTDKLLLALDNCEHLISAVAGLVETLVRMCPNVSVLVTSREIMRIDGERVYRVSPLDVPSTQQGDILGRSAVRLFIARTKALRSDFSPRDDDLPTIAAICRRLDGIPLAIEFAAARAATLGLQQVAARLDDRFGLLTIGRRTALPRHQTLRATLDWSYELLPDSEQRLLRQMAVFPAGFTLEAAAAMMESSDGIAAAVVDGVANLVAKSLMTLDQSVPVDRLRLLDTIRAYALEQLTESGEGAEASRRHAEFFRDLLAPGSPDAQPPPAMAIEEAIRHGREIDNVRAALDWCFSPVGDVAIGIALTAACAPVWIQFALMAECRERAERALDALELHDSQNVRVRMELQIALGYGLLYMTGEVETIRTVLTTALEVANGLDDLNAQLQTLWILWALHTNIAEAQAAHSLAEQFTRVAIRSGNPAVELVADRISATTLHLRGKHREAQRHCERALAYQPPKTQGHAIIFQYDQRALARATLARVLWLRGFGIQAVDHAQTCIEWAREADQKFSACAVLYYVSGPIIALSRDLGAAEQTVAMLIELATQYDSTLWKIVGGCLKGRLLVRRGEFGVGFAVLRSTVDKCEENGWTIGYPESLGVLAEGLAGLGQFAEAIITLERAISWANHGGEVWYVAELLRLKGEFLLQTQVHESFAIAEDCFHKALEVAGRQDALLWELRAAISLARLRMRQSRNDDARQILAPIYDRFTEGFETADQRAAKGMLDSL